MLSAKPRRLYLRSILMRLTTALAALLIPIGLVPASSDAANAPAPPRAESDAGMLAHKALYQLTLDTARSSDVIAATGTMGYEVTDACEGWAVRQELRMAVTNADGQQVQMASDYATWESKNGLKFRYHMKQTTDQAVSSQTDGEASLTRAGGPGEAHYSMPAESTVKLPKGTVFPMAHTIALIAAAREHKHFLSLPLFDGTDENGAEHSFIVVLDWKGPAPNRWPTLAALPSTKVHISFFDPQPSSMTPSYEVTMRYWEDGVADNMKMNFGDFTMDAKLKDFSPQPHRC
jgi:hypothetical protein